MMISLSNGDNMEAVKEGMMHRTWREALTRCEQMLLTVQAITTEHGIAWRDGMVRYWSKRKSELLLNEPDFGE